MDRAKSLVKSLPWVLRHYWARFEVLVLIYSALINMGARCPKDHLVPYIPARSRRSSTGVSASGPLMALVPGLYPAGAVHSALCVWCLYYTLDSSVG